METYTKTELLEAQGPFYQASPSWRKKFEEWIGTDILKPEENEARSHTSPHRYSEDTAYILAVLFHMRAVGFANRRIRDVSRSLYQGVKYEHAPKIDGKSLCPSFGEYWNAAKTGGEPDWQNMVYNHDGQEWRKVDPPAVGKPDNPCELTVYLLPDDGKGFGEDQVSAAVVYGAGPTALVAGTCPHFRINLTELFAVVRLPVRQPPVEATAVSVGRAVLPPSFPQHPVPMAAAALTTPQKRKRSTAKAAVA